MTDLDKHKLIAGDIIETRSESFIAKVYAWASTLPSWCKGVCVGGRNPWIVFLVK